MQPPILGEGFNPRPFTQDHADVDEWALAQIEARIDAECGADDLNAATFDAPAPWCHVSDSNWRAEFAPAEFKGHSGQAFQRKRACIEIGQRQDAC